MSAATPGGAIVHAALIAPVHATAPTPARANQPGPWSRRSNTEQASPARPALLVQASDIGRRAQPQGAVRDTGAMRARSGQQVRTSHECARCAVHVRTAGTRMHTRHVCLNTCVACIVCVVCIACDQFQVRRHGLSGAWAACMPEVLAMHACPWCTETNVKPVCICSDYHPRSLAHSSAQRLAMCMYGVHARARMHGVS